MIAATVASREVEAMRPGQITTVDGAPDTFPTP